MDILLFSVVTKTVIMKRVNCPFQFKREDKEPKKWLGET